MFTPKTYYAGAGRAVNGCAIDAAATGRLNGRRPYRKPSMSGPDQHQSTETSSYHHGNLREALLQEAILCIRRAGVENLSLRALARNIGVSQTAPYRHFTDKNALLAELATLALQELANEFLASITLGKSAPENIQNAGEVYLRYAFDNPEKYRLMFGPTISDRQNHPKLVAAGRAAF